MSDTIKLIHKLIDFYFRWAGLPRVFDHVFDHQAGAFQRWELRIIEEDQFDPQLIIFCRIMTLLSSLSYMQNLS